MWEQKFKFLELKAIILIQIIACFLVSMVQVNSLPAWVEPPNLEPSVPLSNSSDGYKPKFSIYGSNNLYAHVDLDQARQLCEKAKDCTASKTYWIVCGSDGKIYRNIGVLSCAQLCNIRLKLQGFGPCNGSQPLPKRTAPPHLFKHRKKMSITTTTTAIPSHHGKLAGRAGISIERSGVTRSHDLRKSKIRTSSSTRKPGTTGKPVNPVLKDLLIERIKDRSRHHRLPPEWKEWCNENPQKCKYGYDPRYDPEWYLLPAKSFNERDKFLNVERASESKRVLKMSHSTLLTSEEKIGR